MLSSISRLLMTRAVKQLQNQSSRNLSLTSVQHVRGARFSNSRFKPLTSDQDIEIDTMPEEKAETRDIWEKVNKQIIDKSYGRLFAVILVDKHQHKLTDGDLLMVLDDIGASNGQRIRLEKILLIGSKDFTLIGRPLLPRDLINIEATVVEKTLSHKKVNYLKTKKRSHSTNCKL